MRMLVLSFVGALTLGACGHRPRPATVVQMPPQAAPDLMDLAIDATLQSRRYAVVERVPGRVRAQVLGRRAFAVVDILCVSQGVEIHWVDGNVRADRYDRWMRGLAAAIQRRAWRMAHRGVAVLPPMPPGYGVAPPDDEPGESAPPGYQEDGDLPDQPGYRSGAPGAPPPPAMVPPS